MTSGRNPTELSAGEARISLRCSSVNALACKAPNRVGVEILTHAQSGSWSGLTILLENERGLVMLEEVGDGVL